MFVDFDRLGVDFLLVNSTNKFLAEYSSLKENSRYVLTGFSGSTGDALWAKSGEIYLFVDGRYHTQAEQEINEKITLIKLQTGQKQDDEIKKLIPDGAIMGIVGDKVSQKRLENFDPIKVKILDLDPVNFYTEINENLMEILPLETVGESFSDKIKKLPRPFFTGNLEEVSYLLNARDFSENYSSKIQGKLLITDYENLLFTDMKLEEKLDNLEVLPLVEVRNILSMIETQVMVDKAEINVSDYAVIKHPESIFSPIKLMKALKNHAEIEGYKKAFEATDKALFETRDFIMESGEVSEYEIAQELEKNFRKNGAKSLSFKSIVAKGKNSALAHYSKCSKEEFVQDGSLVLIDCGAYFENGLSTDITRVFVKGEPTFEMKLVYTTVLKMFLNAYNAPIEKQTGGYELDKIAREVLSNNRVEGFTFGHGLGHGIGINVHEAPPNLSPAEIAKVPFENGMCFTIEPGLYNPEAFGVRLENSCYFSDNKIKSFSKMPYERKLIEFQMLTAQEKIWLEEFELV